MKIGNNIIDVIAHSTDVLLNLLKENDKKSER